MASDFLKKMAGKAIEAEQPNYEISSKPSDFLASKAANARSEGIKKWFSDVEGLSTKLSEDYDARKDKYVASDEYGKYRDETANMATALQNEAGIYRDYFDRNRDRYGDDAVDELLGAIAGYNEYLGNVKGSLDAEYDYRSQFADEGEYDLHKKQTYWQSIPDAEDYAEKSVYSGKYKDRRGSFDAVAYTLGDNPYSTYLEDEDEDLLGEWINGNNEAGEIIKAKYGGGIIAPATWKEQSARYMTDEEKGIYNYLYNTEGKDAAHDYYKFLESDLNYRNRVAEEEKWAKLAEEDGFGTSVFSVIAKPFAAYSYAGQLVDRLAGNKIDQNAPTNKFSYVPTTIRSEVSKNWGPVGSYAYNLGMSMADSLYTMLPTILTGGIYGNEALITKGVETFMLMTMGMEAAADTVISMKDRGYDDNKAFTLGTIAGAAEFVTEKIGMDNLMKTVFNGMGEKSFKQYLIKAVTSQMAAEGGEEGLSDLINWAADGIYAAISGDPSEFKKTVNEYEQEGYSPETAFGKAVAERAKELGLDILGGGVSGGLFGLFGVGANRVMNISSVEQAIKSAGADEKTASELAPIVLDAALGMNINEADKAKVETSAPASAVLEALDTEMRVDETAMQAANGEDESAGETVIAPDGLARSNEPQNAARGYDFTAGEKNAAESEISPREMTEGENDGILTTPFSKDVEKLFKKADRLYSADLGGEYLVGNGAVFVATDENGKLYTENSIDYKNHSTALIPDVNKRAVETFKTIADNDNIITDRPYATTTPGIKNVLVFDTKDGQIAVNRDLFKLIDEGTLHYDTKQKIIVAVDGSGKITGVVYGIRLPETDLSKLNQVNTKTLRGSNAVNAKSGKESVAEFAATLGKAGEKVFNDMYSEDQNAVGYVDAMMKAYTAGKNGGALEGISSGVVSEPQLKAAYIAGQADGGVAVDKGGDVGYTENKNTVKENDDESVREVSDGRRVYQSSVSGEGTGGLLGEVLPETDGVAEKRGDASENAGRQRGTSERQGDRDGGSGRSSGRGKRTDNAGSPVAGTGGISEEQPGEIKAQNKITEEVASKPDPKGSDFVIPKSGLDLPRGDKSRYTANVEAIKTVRTLQAEKRFATAKEQTALSKYVGWGGLANYAFRDSQERIDELKALLSKEEYDAAFQSTQNAHYTSIEVIRAIYSGLEKMGFKGGNVLEPSAGTGNFIGAMPGKYASKSNVTAIELDAMTGAILGYLYPSANVIVDGFQNVSLPDDYFDLIISNVPFSNTTSFTDKNYDKDLSSSLHNYFFVKSLDKVRPGGIVCFITSSYTMDSSSDRFRRYFSDRANLLGAIRLPNDAFKDNANTEVVTDIIVLQKRASGEPLSGEAFESTQYVYPDYKNDIPSYSLNEYFVNHPDMILGTPARGKMYSRNSVTWNPVEGNLSEQIVQAFEKIKGKIVYPKKPTQAQIIKDAQNADNKKTGVNKNGNIVKRDGKLFENNEGKLKPITIEGSGADKKIRILSSAVDMKDTARRLLDLQYNHGSKEEIAAARKELNELYDNLVYTGTKNGVNGISSLHQYASVIKRDIDFPFILALERWDARTRTASKADIFFKDTMTPRTITESVGTVEDGIAASINHDGTISPAYIANLTNSTEEDVTKQILESGQAYLLPDGSLEMAATYLSGNVRGKLKEAEALANVDKRYKANVEALKKALPKYREADSIKVTMGASFIPAKEYENFASYLLAPDRVPDQWQFVAISHDPHTGRWGVEWGRNAWQVRRSAAATADYGTPRAEFTKIMEAALNNASIEIRDTLEGGVTIVNKDATIQANEKKSKIIDEFQKWIWSDQARVDEYVPIYNDIFNASVQPHYNGGSLTWDGMSSMFTPYDHQKDAAMRMIYQPRMLLAHGAGIGKTMEIAMAVMKMRQLGLAKKPLIVVPKSLITQWPDTFRQYYPNAKLLVPGAEDFTAANRKTFANAITTGDWDAVIITQEHFEKLPMSLEWQRAFITAMKEDAEAAYEKAREKSGKSSASVKALARLRDRLERMLNELNNVKRDTDNVNFESLGCDALFVDEAHGYKNLFYFTTQSNVADMGDSEGAKKTFDMFMKVRYLEQSNGRAYMATATPLMNSAVEAYTFMNYLIPERLEQMGVSSFDDWCTAFGKMEEIDKLNVDGQSYKKTRSMSRYSDVPALEQLFLYMSDVMLEPKQLADKIPKMETGAPIVIETEASAAQKEYLKNLATRAKNAPKGYRHEKGEDSLLKIYSDGKKMSISQRLIDPDLSEDPTGKLYACANKVKEIYDKYDKDKATQIVFCDIGVPGGAQAKKGVNLYEDLKRLLVAEGIPENEIQFYQSWSTTDQRKTQIQEDVRAGKVRVLIGSWMTMGVGLNIQDRLRAVHELTLPAYERPGDVEQGRKRALRQGNMYKEVGIYTYITKGTFDTRSWDNLKRKAVFNNQLLNGTFTDSEAEGDGDFADSAGEIAAIASGNPMIKERYDLDNKIQKLSSLKSAHAAEVARAIRMVRELETEKAKLTQEIAGYEADVKTYQPTQGDRFKAVIGGKTFTGRQEAGEVIQSEVKKYYNGSLNAQQTEKEIGSMAGYKMAITNKGEGVLIGKMRYPFAANAETPEGIIRSAEYAAGRAEKNLSAAKERIETVARDIEKYTEVSKSAFSQEEELQAAKKRYDEINEYLHKDVATRDVAPTDEEDAGDINDIKYFRDDGTSEHPERWTTERIKDGNVTAPRPLSELIAKIQHDLGVNITFGHVRGKGVRGQFNARDKGIRSRIENDLPTISHELGHLLDDKFDLLGTRLPAGVGAELEKVLGPLAKGYPKKQIKSEGLAEYIRQYLTNKDTAEIDYPETTKFVLGSLDAKSLAIIEEFADEINAYFALDADTATSSIVLSEEKAPDFRTLGEKAKEEFDAFYTAWVDANHPIKRFVEAAGTYGDADAYILATNAAYSDNIAARILEDDLTDPDGKYVAPGLKTALQGVNTRDKKEWRDFGEYLAVRHGPERLAVGKRVFSDDRKNNAAWMERRRAELEEMYPAFRDAGTRVVEFERDLVQTWGVNTGLISQELADSWHELYENHVPLNRAIPKGLAKHAGAKNYANQSSPLKRAKGSGLDIIHPVENIMTEIVLLVKSGTLNRVMLEIADTAESAGVDASIMEKIPAPLVPHEFDVTGVKAKLGEGIEEGIKSGTISADSLEGVDAVINGLGDMLVKFEQGKPHGDVVTVMRDGKPEFWKINDKLLLGALTNLSTPQRSALLKAYAFTTRAMTSAITGSNPIWSIFSNAPRDIGTFAAYAEIKTPLQAARAIKLIGETYVQAFNMALRDGKNGDPIFKLYLAMGGGHTSVVTSDLNMAKRARNSFTRTDAQKILDRMNPVTWISFIADTVEMGPRYAMFKILILNGADPQTAFYKAMDVTVNFRKSGYLSSQVNAFVPFFNAGLQGTDKFLRYYTAEDAKRSGKDRGKVAAGRFGLEVTACAVLAALALALNYANKKKREEYQKLSNYTKNSYFCIPLDDEGHYFCIPKARELAVLASLFERVAERAGGNEHSFDEFYSYAADQFLPNILSDIATLPEAIATKGTSEGLRDTMSGILGSFGVAGVAASMAMNRDFLGRPIESQSMQNLEPRDRFNQSTSQAAYWIGKGLNLSPQMIDYFGNQVLGYIWKVPRALFPVGEDQRDWTLGVANTYAKDNAYSQDIVNWLYSKAEQSEKAKNSDKGNMDKAITAKLDDNMTTFYSRFNSLNKENELTTSQREARKTALNMIYEYRKAVDAGAETDAEKLVYDVIRKAGETDLMPGVMATYIKNGDIRYELSDSQYVEFQTRYNGYYYSLAEEVLSSRNSDKENRKLLRQVKTLALEKAKDDMLIKSVGVQNGYFSKYSGVEDRDIMKFEAGVDAANDDGSLKQTEIINILESMIKDGLDYDDAYMLFHSRYDSDKNNPWAKYRP